MDEAYIERTPPVPEDDPTILHVVRTCSLEELFGCIASLFALAVFTPQYSTNYSMKLMSAAVFDTITIMNNSGEKKRRMENVLGSALSRGLTVQSHTRAFNVTGLQTLPVAMVYAGKPDVATRVPGMSASNASAHAFVERLVMQTVFDVLEDQGRSALLPGALISTILGQLTVRIGYVPMRCQAVLSSPTDMAVTLEHVDLQNCIIIGSTVTGICTPKMAMMGKMCTMARCRCNGYSQRALE
ncbi:hypothetical protein KIN20_029582 [Parelaphostrongylus tenuis]|uniref:Uncharacterized protein n=1 Tax=Parelaphostrongylus tenuis TaxID=148309 RepID=A0AAD5WFQ7_PARTN|nr:hypothetical protein KIN20_029582 [Parelaphostrongylus tenuis]